MNFIGNNEMIHFGYRCCANQSRLWYFVETRRRFTGRSRDGCESGGTHQGVVSFIEKRKFESSNEAGHPNWTAECVPLHNAPFRRRRYGCHIVYNHSIEREIESLQIFINIELHPYKHHVIILLYIDFIQSDGLETDACKGSLCSGWRFGENCRCEMLVYIRCIQNHRRKDFCVVILIRKFTFLVIQNIAKMRNSFSVEYRIPPLRMSIRKHVETFCVN